MRFLDPLGFFNMAASGHFGFLALSKFAQISQTGVGAYFVTNTLKYQNQPLNFTSQRLVTESMILTLLLQYIKYFFLCSIELGRTLDPCVNSAPLNKLPK